MHIVRRFPWRLVSTAMIMDVLSGRKLSRKWNETLCECPQFWRPGVWGHLDGCSEDEEIVCGVHVKARGGIPAGSIGVPRHKEVWNTAVQVRLPACRRPHHSSCDLSHICVVGKETPSFTNCVINLVRGLSLGEQRHDLVSLIFFNDHSQAVSW